MRKKGQSKGIFCIEGLWSQDLRISSSVVPFLDLLNLNAPLEYIHLDCATAQEFEFYLLKWVQKRYDRFPILYLASHGYASGVELGKDRYSIEDLGTFLEGKCANRLIMFSACSTLGIDKRILKTFLRRTDALAVCGYRTDVNWMHSTAFELLVFSHIQKNEFSGRGIEAIAAEANAIAKSFRELEFVMVTVKDLEPPAS